MNPAGNSPDWKTAGGRIMEVLFSTVHTSRKLVESETYIEKWSFPTSATLSNEIFSYSHICQCYFIGIIFTATNFDLRHYAPSGINTAEGNYQCGPAEMWLGRKLCSWNSIYLISKLGPAHLIWWITWGCWNVSASACSLKKRKQVGIKTNKQQKKPHLRCMKLMTGTLHGNDY